MKVCAKRLLPDEVSCSKLRPAFSSVSCLVTPPLWAFLFLFAFSFLAGNVRDEMRLETAKGKQGRERKKWTIPSRAVNKRVCPGGRRESIDKTALDLEEALASKKSKEESQGMKEETKGNIEGKSRGAQTRRKAGHRLFYSSWVCLCSYSLGFLFPLHHSSR